MKSKWDIDDDQLGRKCVDEVISRIEEMEGSQVGVIAAQDVIDIVMDNLAPTIYNKGIEDARRALQGKVQDIEVDLDLLRHKP